MTQNAINERLKITATWLNGAGIAAVAVGSFAPITAFITSATPIPVYLLDALVLGWLCISFGLHMAARRILRRIV
jgi:hypothetical protein